MAQSCRNFVTGNPGFAADELVKVGEKNRRGYGDSSIPIKVNERLGPVQV